MINMLLIICDVITTFLKCSLTAWACHNIASKENKISKFKSVLLTIIIMSLTLAFTYSNFSFAFANLLMIIGSLIIVMVFYRKSVIDALLGFGAVYATVVITSYFIITFYKEIITMNLKISPDLQMILFVFIPAWTVYFCFFMFKKVIFNAILLIKDQTKSLVFFIIFIYSIIVLDTLRIQLQFGNLDSIFKFIFYFTAFTIFISIVAYFSKINEKSKEVEMLNAALNEKITELRKIKHDYGSEISGLYGLYQMDRTERLGEMLKNIVDRSQALNTSIYVTVQATPIIKAVFSSIESSNIDMIVSDEADYEDIAITDDELFKVISNIVRNSVDALKEAHNPIIKFRSHNLYDAVFITISNNGPEIPKEIKDKIFQEGFSTKNNFDGDRGYGLSIVSDIIDKYKGKITIDSNKELTQFNIEIPYNKLQ